MQFVSFCDLFTATYPLLWCHTTKDMLSQKCVEERNLGTIKEDYLEVEEQEFSIQSKREHHSVSHQPFFNIPINQVRIAQGLMFCICMLIAGDMFYTHMHLHRYGFIQLIRIVKWFLVKVYHHCSTNYPWN